MFNWADYHQLAVRLQIEAASRGLEEASLRASVSRFYYGAFQTARRQAERKGFAPRGSGEDHSAVRRHFRDRGKRSLAESLSELQIWRELCDYRDQIQNLPMLAENAKHAAEHVHRLL